MAEYRLLLYREGQMMDPELQICSLIGPSERRFIGMIWKEQRDHPPRHRELPEDVLKKIPPATPVTTDGFSEVSILVLQVQQDGEWVQIELEE